MKHVRIAGLAAVVLITLALASEQAGAIPAVANISNNAGASYWPSIGMNGTTALAVWQDSTPGNYDIFMARSLNTGTTWAAPVNLTNTAGTSQEYDWAFAGRYVYLVWSDNTPGNYDIFLRRSLDGGATFSSALNLSMNAGASALPRIALSGGSNVYVVWEDQTAGNKEVYFTRSVNGGASFGAAVNLSNTVSASVAPSIVAFGPHVYVLWTDQLSGNGDVFLRHSTDGGATFSAAVNVSNTAGNSAFPAMAIAGPNVYVVWEDYSSGNWEIMFRASANGGITFGSSSNVSNTGATHSYIPRAIVSGTFVYTLWLEALSNTNTEVFYRRSINSGASWQPIRNLSNDAGSSDGEFASWTLAGTDLYAAWTDYTPGNGDIFYRRSKDAGGVFAASVNISGNGGASLVPQVLSVGRDLYSVWADSTTGNYEILFARSTVGGFSMPGPGDARTGWAGGSSNPSVPVWCAQPRQSPDDGRISCPDPSARAR